MAEHIFEIIIMLLGAAILGFLIAWFWRNIKISKLENYIDSLEDKTNRLQSELSENEKQLIDCQTGRKKIEADKQTIKKLLDECNGKLKVSVANPIKKEVSTENYKEKNVEKKLSGQDTALERVKAKAGNIDFNRIGTANEETKDDLKLIKGIGPFIEKKLNALGIFTFKQIANFNDQDKDKVNEAIEFFPGRIKRDDWVGQSKDFIK